jgi:1,4-dihydroxy-2-naphthoate octaprenyltransferase
MFYCFTLLGVALGIGIVSSYRPWSLLALLAFPVAFVPARLALGDEEGRALLPMLGTTARLQILTGALLAVGLLL